MKISKTKLQQIFNEQFENLALCSTGSPPPEPRRPWTLRSTEEIFIEIMVSCKSEGLETFEEVWERLGVPDGQDHAIIWSP